MCLFLTVRSITRSACPKGQACFSSTIDCSKPQPKPSDPPTYLPTRVPEGQAINNEGEVWGDSNGDQEVDNGGENWGSGNNQQIDNEKEDDVNNEGEDWGSGNKQQNDNAKEDDVNNEGEDWGSNNSVNNDGEEWSKPVSDNKPTSSSPTPLPTPRVPTPEPTPDPTIDLMTHLENLKNVSKIEGVSVSSLCTLSQSICLLSSPTFVPKPGITLIAIKQSHAHQVTAKIAQSVNSVSVAHPAKRRARHHPQVKTSHQQATSLPEPTSHPEVALESNLISLPLLPFGHL